MKATTRTLTVLFTDMVASTELMTRIGEAAHAVRERYFAALRNTLAVHDGVEIKTLGDGMMAVFTSTRQAIACASAMQHEVAAAARKYPGEAFQQRIGLTIGEVRVEGGDLFGVAVVEAARLCATAAPGQILLTDVLRLIAGQAAGAPMTHVGEVELKGLPQPRTVWQVDWDTGPATSLRVALVEDLALLRQGVASMLEKQGFEVVLQAGDPDALFTHMAAARPHVVILDVRMPPTYTNEGLLAAQRLAHEYPEVGVLVMSASLTPVIANQLIATASAGIGYLGKESVGDLEELVGAVRAVAAGGVAIDARLNGKVAARPSST